MENEGLFAKKSDAMVEKENEKWFKAYLAFPKIFAGLIMLTFFILGIVFASAWGQRWAIPAFWFGGALVSVIFYASLKIFFSYSILHIYYLRRLLNNSKDENTEEDDEELPTI